MAGNEISSHIGTKLTGAQGSNRGDKAVDHHRTAGHGCTNERTTHSGNIKAAYLSNHIDHIVFVRLINLDSGLDNLLLFEETGICDTTPTTRHILYGCIQQNGKHRSGSGGIANAHFTNAKHVRIGILS